VEEKAFHTAYSLAVFGFGSVVGMALIGAIISLPLRYLPRGLTWLHNGLRGLVGLVTLGLGGYICFTVGIEINA
jgi:hypothetical protein